MCRNAASINTEPEKCSQVLAVAAALVYHSSSLAGYQRPFGRRLSIINTKLAGRNDEHDNPIPGFTCRRGPQTNQETLLSAEFEAAACPADFSSISSAVKQQTERRTPTSASGFLSARCCDWDQLGHTVSVSQAHIRLQCWVLSTVTLSSGPREIEGFLCLCIKMVSV